MWKFGKEHWKRLITISALFQGLRFRVEIIPCKVRNIFPENFPHFTAQIFSWTPKCIISELLANSSQISSRKRQKIFLHQARKRMWNFSLSSTKENDHENENESEEKYKLILVESVCEMIVVCAGCALKWLRKQSKINLRNVFPTNTLKWKAEKYLNEFSFFFVMFKELFLNCRAEKNSLICLFAVLLIVPLISSWKYCWKYYFLMLWETKEARFSAVSLWFVKHHKFSLKWNFRVQSENFNAHFQLKIKSEGKVKIPLSLHGKVNCECERNCHKSACQKLPAKVSLVRSSRRIKRQQKSINCRRKKEKVKNSWKKKNFHFL